jgi:membrane fusion protein (multidrug efflux system)
MKDGAITQKQYDDSKANLEVTSKQLEATKNDVIVAQSRIGIIQAQLKKAEAQIALKKTRIEQQKLKLSYTKIYATTDGKIGKRNIDAGQFVQAGAPLFTIVNDNQFWVVANFKETQLEHIKLGQEVEVKLDAYKNQPLKGTIVSISDATGAKFSLLPPDNATGNFVKVTQRVPVKIEIEEADKYKSLLRAGMSVEVSIAY